MASPIRRQGVVYRGADVRREESSSPLVRAVGALITLTVSFGLLGLIAAAFLGGTGGGQREVAVAPSGTPAATRSARPSVDATVVPTEPSGTADPGQRTSAPEPSPSLGQGTPTREPAGPLGTPPPVATGIGSVRFGSESDGAPSGDARTDFTFDQTVAVRATLRDEPGPLPLVMEILRVDGSQEERVRRELVPISDPNDATITRAMHLATVVPGPGFYELRYLRDGAELAAGSFLVTDP